MRARTEILRIRNYAGRWTVTHKRLPDVGPGEDAHKHLAGRRLWRRHFFEFQDFRTAELMNDNRFHCWLP